MMPVNQRQDPMTTATTRSASLSSSVAFRAQRSWRLRWRLVRELLSGALILAVWLALWSWFTLGVAAPLGRTSAEAPFSTTAPVAGLRS